MRRLELVLVSLAVLATSQLAAGQAPEESGPSLPPFIALRSIKGTALFMDGRFIASHIEELQKRSATFADMLTTIGSIPGVKVLITPSAALHDGPHDLIGLTTLRRSRDGFTAWTVILVDRTQPRLTVEAIGHELGHVAEAACLGRFESISELRTALRRRADRFTSRTGKDFFETPFPYAVGKAVVNEWLGNRPQARSFDDLVVRFGLTQCRTSAELAHR